MEWAYLYPAWKNQIFGIIIACLKKRVGVDQGMNNFSSNYSVKGFFFKMMLHYVFNIVRSSDGEQNCPHLVLILYAFSVFYWICRFKSFWVMTFFISAVWAWRSSDLACFCTAAPETELYHLCSVWRSVFRCLQGKDSDCRCQDGNIGFQEVKKLM